MTFLTFAEIVEIIFKLGMVFIEYLKIKRSKAKITPANTCENA
jgi:hypothetical protein